MDAIEVPDTPSPVSMSDLGILQHLYPQEVILGSECHAMDIYCNVLYFVNERIDNIIYLYHEIIEGSLVDN